MKSFQDEIIEGIPNDLVNGPVEESDISRAPKRRLLLSRDEQALALRNALRYFPEALHETLAEEFLYELQNYGRIYMFRYRPQHAIFARPIDEYPAKTPQAAAIMLMIQNNIQEI